MGGFVEYDQYDALGLAGLVAQGQVSPVELCQEAIGRIEALNPALNAVIFRLFDQGLAQAEEGVPVGPFSGVPFLVKDLMYDCAGAPTSEGCQVLKDRPIDHDSEMVSRFRQAGLIILGKTNTPEFGLKGITEPEAFGPCRNPWDTDRTPGGSSGGSASAVAAGMVPAAAGGDGGGSIRIPSAYCGLFGLKPSRGRNPSGPDHGRVWQGAVQDHVLTRSVRDSAAFLDVTQGPDPGTPYIIKPPEGPYVDEVGRQTGRLRVAFHTASPLGMRVDKQCIRAVEEAAGLLEDMGHRVVEARPKVDGRELARAYFMLYYGEVAADLDRLSRVLGRKARPGDVEPDTWSIGLLGRSFSAGDMINALRVWDRAARTLGRFFQSHDIYLTPTTALLQARIGQLEPPVILSWLVKAINSLRAGWLPRWLKLVDKMAFENLERTPFTQLANLTGLPAMSVPLHWTPEGLPVGVQFIAPFGREDLLFRLAGRLEEARPWFDKKPDFKG